MRELTTDEADVIEAAQDWLDACIGSKYGPMQHEIWRSEAALEKAVSGLMAENEGRWRRPQ